MSDLAVELADRIKTAAEQIPDGRALAFREALSWGAFDSPWILTLENVKRALAVSDDEMMVGVTVAHLEDQRETQLHR